MQSLLFCQDEKSARVLIPLVEGLDIGVVQETEVFSAMKTLMAERFDFLIIDYENEQTGRILLKNARSTAGNKGALAVAVVNPETGATALRLGADFLIRRPINLGQAEGVLRLVRSSVMRAKGSPAESATQATAAEPMLLSQESAASEQNPNAVMANELITTDSSASANSSSLETSVACGSDEQATLSPAPMVQPENAANPVQAMSIDVPSEQSKIQSYDVPANVVTNVQTTRPQRFLVSMAALGVILLVMAAIAWRIHTANSWAKGNAPAQSSAVNASVQPKEYPAEPTTVPAPGAAEPQMQELTTKAPGALAIVPGPLSIHPTSQGTRTRTTKVVAGNHLPVRTDSDPPTITVSLNSDPAKAAVWMDGKDTGRLTPAQISVDKPGTHTFVFRKQGYLDETTTTNLRIGETFDFSPSLRALGYTDEIRMVGTFRKIFGGGESARQGIVSVKTEPKGAQIAVNGRTIEKPSPAKFYLNPGNYVIDITIAGFKVIHRVVTVEKGGKITIDEVMDPE
jgi:hypothetical protein